MWMTSIPMFFNVSSFSSAVIFVGCKNDLRFDENESLGQIDRYAIMKQIDEIGDLKLNPKTSQQFEEGGILSLSSNFYFTFTRPMLPGYVLM